jgi:hypothetical protein
MMRCIVSRRLGHRLLSIVLVLATVLPTTATIGRADDDQVTVEPVNPGSSASTPVPAFAPTTTVSPTAPPATSVPTATPRTPTAVPTTQAANDNADQPAGSGTPQTTGSGTPQTNASDSNRPASAGVTAAACPPPDRVEPTSWHLEGDDAINNMRGTIADTLKMVQVREPGLTGEIRGFRAGAFYAHIYARDSATIAPAAQYLYDLPYLTRPVDEFLALQYDGRPDDPEDLYWKSPAEPGAVSGTIGGGEIAAAKMLVVSDEEPSVVSMAYVAYKAGAGREWLLGQQAGKPRIDRLNMAMDWIFEHRYDRQVHLVKRGNTTDWGDVAVGVGSSSGSYTKEPVDWTASIYDQAWTYRALIQLAEMNTAAGRQEAANRQQARARTLRQSVAERLWQPDRGYFRTRILLPPLTPDVDEDRIVSIANAVAVYTGIADPTERKPIFTALEMARLAAGATKPGLSLWPPYPLGFFDYPQMTPGRYQNGAVWDWWGGMQISGQFWTGYSTMGRQSIDQVAADWSRDPGAIYEWQEPRSATNAGSPAYAGAASTMAEAIISGLYGVQLTPAAWAISARLGPQSGGIHVFHPPSSCVLDYWHTYAGDKIAVEWETNHPSAGELRVTLPDNVTVGSALLDQKSVRMKIEALGDDTIAVLPMPAPTGKHRLELRLVPGGA